MRQSRRPSWSTPEVDRMVRGGHGVTMAQVHAPSFTRIQSAYLKLKSREERIDFIDTWLKSWAKQFEDTWPVIYQALQWVEQDRLYADAQAVGDQRYADFRAYFEARLKRPFTLWMEMEQTHHYVAKYAPELIEATFSVAQAARAKHMQDADEEDQQQQRPAGKHIDPDLYNNDSDIQVTKAPTGTSTAAALRRLRKDRPDIHERVLAGEISAHAGMVEAGFRKPRPSQKRTRVERVLKQIEAMTKGEQREIWICLAREFRS